MYVITTSVHRLPACSAMVYNNIISGTAEWATTPALATDDMELRPIEFSDSWIYHQRHKCPQNSCFAGRLV